MAKARSGRSVRIYEDGVIFIAARTKTINFSNEGIDVTDDSTAAARLFMEDESSTLFVDMTIEGLLKDASLITSAATDGGSTHDLTVSITDIGTLTGTFRVGSIQIGAPYNDANTFSGTLASTGSYAFTPAGS